MGIFDKPLFIFDMANNHQGDVEHGKKIIKEINKVVDKYKEYFDFSIKFQYRNLDTFIHPDYVNRMDVKNVKRFEETRLEKDQFAQLKEEVKKCGMYTICTPFDEISVDLIKAQDFDVIKIASCSFTDWPLLEKIAMQDKPVIASAAGSSMADIKQVVTFFKHRNIKIALMHCIAEYPTLDENLQMNQITLYKKSFPDMHIGFSTHEAPDNLEPIKVAVAKGAEIFEKHVGVETDTITLNGYSATPEQVEKWLDAALRTYKMCGVSEERYAPNPKEMADLAALQRGVYVRKGLTEGQKINMNDIYLAFPCQPGQVIAKNLSKYSSIKIKEGITIEKNAPVMLNDVIILDDTVRIQTLIIEVMKMLKKSNVVIPYDSTCEISHHYGLANFEQTGVTMFDCINREYCKKILVVLPGQSHPFHNHQTKEETFTVIYGSLETNCDGVTNLVKQGESMVVERGVNHSFRSDEGCVFEEISTTHYNDDSYYEEAEKFVNPRKTTVYITKEMLDNMAWPGFDSNTTN